MPEQIEQPVEEESVEEEYPVTMTVETTVEISAEALIDPTVPGNDRNEAWCDKHADWEWRNALGWMFVVVDYDKGLSPEYDPEEMLKEGCTEAFVAAFFAAREMRPTNIAVVAAG